jgi:hypothetical protein
MNSIILMHAKPDIVNNDQKSSHNGDQRDQNATRSKVGGGEDTEALVVYGDEWHEIRVCWPRL